MKVRNSNFELMRIISMLMIVMGHVLYHGNLITNSKNPTLSIAFTFIFYFLLLHVNSYVLLTGYYQSNSKFKQSKLWALISSTMFYKIVIMVLFAWLGLIKLTKVQILWELFPLNINEYWYVKYYFFLYCISPILNCIINRTKKSEQKKILLVLFLILSLIPFFTGGKAFSNSGYNLTNFIFLYLIGAYLRENPVKESYLFKNISKNAYKLVLLSLLMFMVIFNVMLHYVCIEFSTYNSVFKDLFGGIDSMTSAYSNPIIIFQTIFYFLYFETLDIKSKFINKVSSLTLGVYLISDNSFVRMYMYKWLGIDNGPIYSYEYLIYLFIDVAIIFVVCAGLEYIRQIIFKLVRKLKITKRFREKYYNYLKSLKVNNIATER